MLEKDMVQSKLANLLYKLTINGKANWVRRKADSNYFYCFVNNEKIKVRVEIDENDDIIHCLEKPFIIFSIHYRDAEFKYFGNVCSGDEIIQLLKLVPEQIDDNEFQKLNQLWFDYWESHLLDDLTKYSQI